VVEIGLFEAMYSARALRRDKPDPIPDEIITKVLDAAVRAPSGSNQQHWVFLVVKDAEKRRRISELYRKGAAIMQSLDTNPPRPPHMREKDYELRLSSASYLFQHLHEAPVHLFACLRDTAYASAT